VTNSDILAEMLEETRAWAKAAKQCTCCQGWALLDENGHCHSCAQPGHFHITGVTYHESDNDDNDDNK